MTIKRWAYGTREGGRTCIAMHDGDYERVRDTMRIALAALERVEPQAQGALVIEDVRYAVKRAREAVAWMEDKV